MLVATYNAGNRRDSWELVRSLNADVVLLQEVREPPVDLGNQVVWAGFAQGDTRRWGTAVFAPEFPIASLPAATSELGSSWPGTVANAEVAVPTGGVLTAISVHAISERVTCRLGGTARAVGFATTTVERAVSDTIGYLWDGRRLGRSAGFRDNWLVFGGDLNLNPGWDLRQKTPHHRLALEGIAGFGLRSVLEIRTDDRFATLIRDRVPYRQCDYLFVSERLATRGWVKTGRRSMSAMTICRSWPR